MARSSADDGVRYQRLAAPWDEALALFSFAGAWAPAPKSVAAGWGARTGERLSGALLGERAGSAAMLHGPVVITPSDAPSEVAVDVAAHLVADALTDAESDGIDTVYTRPQGLDGVWVRSGFIPIPEAELPKGLRGRPGIGLFGWRGGTALWSSAGRTVTRRRQVPPR